jgi:dethiobiotin synthetase
MRGLFVTGTDTGVGKTQVSCALLQLWAQAGLRPAAMKPAETGCDPDPADALALREAAGSADPLDLICPYRLRQPLAPAVAARREGRELSLERILECARTLAQGDRPLLVEGAGGLLVPLTERESFADLAVELGLPAVIVARAGLGTINHTCLTVEALIERRIRIRAIVINRAISEADPSEVDNPAEIARITGICTIGPVPFQAEVRARRDQISSQLATKMDPLEWLA